MSPSLLRLSQGQLNLLAACPRRFQHIYLDQLASPVSPEQQENMAWGNRFHLLMQQHELGLPLTELELASEADLFGVVQSFIAAAPDLFGDRSDTFRPAVFRPATFRPATFRQSEHRRSLELQGYLLTVVYDLVILDAEHAQILDWKTYAKPQNQQWLAQDWQTRLYRFVLVETSRYLPEHLSMTYWFVRSSQQGAIALQPQSLRFAYSAAEHERTRQDLTQLLNQLTAWIDGYTAGADFPRTEELRGTCNLCQFEPRCQWDIHSSSNPLSAWSDMTDIAEVAI
jgi:hypothetical protein